MRREFWYGRIGTGVVLVTATIMVVSGWSGRPSVRRAARPAVQPVWWL